jgi:hypothetical protein
MVDYANTGLSVPVTSRAALISYVKRQLGEPLLRINVDDIQIDDAIDNALQYFQDYHSDATERVYYKYQITDTDVANKYLPIPGNIIGVNRIIPLTDGNSTINMFDIRYQIRLNDLYDFTTTSVTHYWMTMTHLRLLDMLFNGEAQVRFNRHNGNLYIDWDWSNNAAGVTLSGQYIIVEGFQILNPTEFTDTWNDRWLKQYAVLLVKKQWGTNLKKFGGIQLVGGVTLNGKEMYDEATAELKDWEQYLQDGLQTPPEFYVG